MAQMIPPIPNDFHGSQGEERVFRALRSLPDEIVVLHSLRWIHAGSWNPNINRPQGEGDFVVIHPQFGILVVEVKGGEIRCEDGQWYQKNRKSGHEEKIWPEEQANRTKFRILEELKTRFAGSDATLVCHAVWFPDQLIVDRTHLPMSYPDETTLDSTHLSNPENAILKAFSFWKNSVRNSRPPGDRTIDLRRTLCPTFSLVHSVRKTTEEWLDEMVRLTQEQARVIGYLDQQMEAAIVGPAGTGKTLLAIEKARRLATPHEPVLFLCFNSALSKHLQETHRQANVSYRSFHGFAREIVGPHGDLDSCVQRLLEYLCDGVAMPYTHLVIDEAQDFVTDWLDMLRLHFQLRGAFYVFYDPFQAVQNDRDAAWLNDIPCRLTLTKNCRNSDQVCKLAYKSAGIKVGESQGLDGPKPTIYPVPTIEAARSLLNRLVNTLLDQDAVPANEIAILSLKTIENSGFRDSVFRAKTAETPEPGRITFNTTRRFKGLEAMHVFVVDVDFEQADDTDWRKLLYIACSRARLAVHIITTTNEANLKPAIEVFGKSEKRRTHWKTISRLLSVKIGES
ncbi:NERD domain-containing protein [Blastopirellula sp. JC732]|uniref:DNA 3'-5' helicase II n=1 Tax=Blastopirellula sediminis TaxID=2894196 RepID=A0A9X1ML87_9BACT|nr:NERD domain-containing protein [Blastopirellula sediminis]MCC9608572.1 NERD domain-containing protein [Blastopirellula sediminis]MCC9628651.1 NERD domain-containing protein [Blastopirellula sediminis]